MKKIKSFYDIIVLGGGIVGASTALYLAQSGFDVLLIENKQIKNAQHHNKPDLRVLAINYHSVTLLNIMNIWQNIDNNLYVTYKKVETWEYSLSKVTFNSESINLSNMGIIIEYNILQKEIWRICNNNNFLTFYCPGSLTSMKYQNKNKLWYVILNNGYPITSKLIIGADGIHSKIRKLSGIPISYWQYPQSCMVLRTKIEISKLYTVWQIFTPSGPRSCLPLYNNWASLMLYDNIEYINKLINLPTILLEKKIQINFARQLGKIKIYDRVFFLLFFHHAHEYIRPGVVLIGDAAHSMHPLAGQGVNLGLRDAEILVKTLTNARNRNESWHEIEILKIYQDNCMANNLSMQLGIDFLHKIFNNNYTSLKLIRNLGCYFIQNSKIIKKYLLKYALGLYN